MTDQELRRLSRTELVEILYEQQKRNEALAAENERLRAQLEQRELKIADAGSIAEAALQLSGVFEAAQAAADQYLHSIHAANAGMAEKQESAERRASEILADAEQRAAALIADAERQADESWTQFEQKANELILAHEELRALVARRPQQEE